MFPGGSDVCLEALRERVDVFFQPGEAQGPSDIAVRNRGSPQDDIIRERTFKECELGIDREPSTTIGSPEDLALFRPRLADGHLH